MEWTRGPIIGRGSSATVSLATNSSGELFAVKSTELSCSNILQREYSLISQLNSPFLVNCFGFDITSEQNKTTYNMFMEYIPGGTLSDLIKKQGGSLNESVIKSYAQQILQGLDYLHSIGVVHCDIKGQNILIGQDGIKIADLGCGKFVRDENSANKLLIHSSISLSLFPDRSSYTNTTMSFSIVEKTLYLVHSEDPILKVEGARVIRRLTKSSLRYRRHFSDAVKPLVDMLRSTSFEFIEAALLALLNLSVKDEGNKKSIIEAGALEPIIGFLQSENASLQDYATASLLTLSASSVTKPILSSFGVIPLLVDILRRGSSHAKVDSILTLYNLSTYQGNLTLILETEPIPSIISLLKSCKKSSKTAEKCTALIESLMCYEEGRNALTSEEGGIFAIVEVLEIGSLQSREHAVGALLTMCQIDRCKYRELILREGVMPGLLELTVKGTTISQEKSQILLRLLRDTPYKRSELKPDTLENIVSNLISQLDGNEQTGKARGLLAEVIQVSMDQSLRHLHLREMVFTPVDLSVSSGASEISST